VAGRADLVERAANRMTLPGIGGECGASLNVNRSLYQGFFMAPHVTAQAVKTAAFCAGVMEEMGYKFESFEVAYLPTTETAVEGEDNIKNMTRLLDSLDEDDDVQEVWHNLANEDVLDR
jgi:cystathionine beta-lyase family protein involved in aluminum resistance